MKKKNLDIGMLVGHHSFPWVIGMIVGSKDGYWTVEWYYEKKATRFGPNDGGYTLATVFPYDKTAHR